MAHGRRQPVSDSPMAGLVTDISHGSRCGFRTSDLFFTCREIEGGSAFRQVPHQTIPCGELGNPGGAGLGAVQKTPQPGIRHQNQDPPRITLGAGRNARATDERRIPIAQSKRIPLAGDLLQLVETSLDVDKAENIAVIDLSGKTAIADYLVIASGTSQRHVGAMADHIQRRMKGMGLKSVAVEGLKQCDWVLIDAGDLIVHLFRPEVRLFYNLEKIWKNTRSTVITEAQSAGV